MTTYEVEFEKLDLHWIVYKVTTGDNKRVPMMRFISREQAEEYIEVILKI